ncbi:peptidoglycan recognition protein [Streptomyces sp. NPDC015661]|uniref:peptidoglycan recognition protein family protein n=1 Tax=Streptomyces sp. NPDC015661 TaxID=3364961 RepID=UPI0036F9CDDD
MRASLASSIAVTCAAVLALPVSLTAPAAASAPPAAASALPPAPELPGSTQSLPLEPLGAATRSLVGGATGSGEQGLTRRDVRPFSLVGVVWDDPAAPLHGTVQVRTRATGGGAWSEWQDVETHNEEHGADPGTAEGSARALRGSTAPLWVGDSDGVEIRVRGEEPLPAGLRLELVDPGEAPSEAPGEAPGQDPAAEPEAPAPHTRSARIPAGPVGLSAAEAAASAVNAQLAPYGAAWIPALSKEETELAARSMPQQEAAQAAEAAEAAGTGQAAEAGQTSGTGQAAEAVQTSGTGQAAEAGQTSETGQTAEAVQGAQPAQAAQPAPFAQAARGALAAKPYIGPRPKIITRKGWGADESIREKGFVYTKTIKAAFVHHSATGNNYTCKQAPSVLRSIYRYHVKSSGWRDFGYNFAVDKCGNIYEGRAGGVAKPVMGAHTLGFNTNSMGIAVLGTFSKSNPPAAVVTAVARLTAWKLGLHGVNPKGTSTLISGGGNLYKKGTTVRFNAIAGHRDGFATECPGGRLYGKLGTARATSAKYQGRP